MAYQFEQFPQVLFDELALNPKKKFYVAFSGGQDSTVLLHLLNSIRERYGFSLTALHVNHNINSASADWAEHCRSICKDLMVPIKTVSLQLEKNSEVEARIARYHWFKDQMEPDSYLLTAHHGQDRAETLLFNLMRGAGSQGLSSLRAITPFYGSGLIRPLLIVSQEDITGCALENNLVWRSKQSTIVLRT